MLNDWAMLQPFFQVLTLDELLLLNVLIYFYLKAVNYWGKLHETSSERRVSFEMCRVQKKETPLLQFKTFCVCAEHFVLFSMNINVLKIWMNHTWIKKFALLIADQHDLFPK